MNSRDSGYARLRAVLDVAHARPGMNNAVRITRLGDNAGTWELITGDHVERDGTLHLGHGIRVLSCSTVADTNGGRARWCGGHMMPDGRYLERFTLDDVAVTLEWQDMTAAKAA